MNFMLSLTPWTLLREEKREHLQGKGQLLSPHGVSRARSDKLHLRVVHSEGLSCVEVHEAVEGVPRLQDRANKRQSISIQLLPSVWIARPDAKY